MGVGVCHVVPFFHTDGWVFQLRGDSEVVDVVVVVLGLVVATRLVIRNRIQKAGLGENGIWCRRWETAVALFFLTNLSFLELTWISVTLS